MKLHSIFITSLLLIPGFSAHAMEQAETPVDQKSQLHALVIACDAAGFKATWQQYQESTQPHELATAHTELAQLATQLCTQKTEERATKLKDTLGRVIAGASAIPLAALSVGTTPLFIWVIIENCKDHKMMCIPIITPLIYKCFGDAIIDAICTAIFAGITLYFTRLAKHDISYARHAGTQQLTKEITALDEIISCLNPQDAAITDTQTEQMK